MKIIEARDGFIKFYAENIYLSSFVMTENADKRYVAQVLQIKEQDGVKVGFAKILYLYDGELYEYDKSLPQPDVDLIECTKSIIKKISEFETPIIIGKTKADDADIILDASVFDKKLLVSVDAEDDNNILARNLLRQSENLGKKTIIIDTLGVIKAKKYVAGVDFKLPLDTASFAFLYEDCLGDATSDSKATIIDIFKELSEYSKTVPFVPFGTLKSIVDDMVNHSHVFKLLVLKNKLAKLEKLGYFAAKKEQVDKFYQIIAQKSAVIDLSKLNPQFLNRYLSFIYEAVQTRGDIQIILELSNSVSKKNIKTALTSNAATICITHSNFKYLNDIKTLFANFIVVPSISNNRIFKQYSILLKYMEKGTFLVAGEALSNVPLVSKLELIEEFPQVQSIEETDDILEEIAELDETSENDIAPKSEIFNTIEEKSEEAIAEATENIETPENIEMFTEDDEDEDDFLDEELVEEVNENNELDEENIEAEPESIQEETLEMISENSDEEIVTENTSSKEDSEPVTELELELSEDIPLEETQTQLEPEIVEDDSITLDTIETDLDIPEEQIEPALETEDELQLIQEDGLQEEASNKTADVPKTDDLDVMPINDNEFGMEEIVELNPEEAGENDIVIDMGDAIEETVNEEVEEQIVQDVDKVFTTMKETDEISDSDLDFIDELNSDEDIILDEVSDDEAILDELAQEDDNNEILDNNLVQETYDTPEETENLEVRDTSTPIVPVYDADIPQEDLVMSDPIEQGDNVVHAKYGNGVVEKMIKYGSKTLYSINFENLGRRLLDPTLTEIKKG